jgi:uncharacterized protein (DUF305 family)
MRTFTFKTTLIAAFFFTIPTLASAQDMKGMDMGSSPADQANMQAMHKMQDAMPKQGTGNPDKDFVTMMIPHHQGAIDMAKVEIQYGKDSKLKRMAAKIVKDQEREIREMQDWLNKHK